MNATLATVAGLLLQPVFFWTFKIARPEMLVALFGLASVLVTEQATRSSRSLLWAVAAGLLAACAMLAHLYGAIFVGAGGVVLLVRRRFPEAVVFGAAATLALVPYAVDIVRHRDIFEAQFHGKIVKHLTTFSPATPLFSLLNEHKRLFRKPQIIFPSTLFFVCLGLGWRLASPRIRFLAGYTLLLMAALGALAIRKEIHYATCLAPLELLVIVGIMMHLDQLDRWRRQVLLAFAVMFAMSGAWFDGRDLKGKVAFEELHRVVASPIPDGAWCLAPMPLLFNEVTRLHLVATFALPAALGPDPSPDSVRAFITSRRIQYVVSMLDNPGESLLRKMEPLEPVSSGVMEGTDYRVFKVVYPGAAQ